MMLDVDAPAADREQTRARYPDATGCVERNGIRVFWELYGAEHRRTVVLLPTWSLVHSRYWRGQIAYLSRHCRVVTFDGRGNGLSDRPLGPEHYAVDEFVGDTLAVMDATGTRTAGLASASCGALWATVLAADHPDRVDAVVHICPAVPLAPDLPERGNYRFDEVYPPEQDGWALYNRHAWLRDYPRFLEFFLAQCFSEPHSTKAIEDGIGWALQTTPELLIDTIDGLRIPRGEEFRDVCGRVRCPTLVIHGDDDRIRPPTQGEALAAASGGQMVTFAGSGHMPELRDPVRVNLLLREWFCPAAPAGRWTRARARRRRALYVSSPIGLGHARRDLAIARELRALHPDLEIDWLAQHPVTALLETHGERIHPASRHLASESGHMASESAEHELDCFQAWRRMDEILLANFMVFHDVVAEQQYDLWIGDEAWDLDYFLHENPELKTAPFAWLTDFVGWLPMPDGGEREAMLTADYNAEMIEQIARHPSVRDRAVFIGEPDDIVAGTFGPGLPAIRSWTEDHYRFSGYVTGFDVALRAERAALRAELGYRESERVCLVSVGGSGIGADLLRRVIASFPAARRLVPDLRMVIVAGPRIDPASLPVCDGLEVRGFVPDLYRHLAACDLAIVQGGLTTTMELTALQRPFIYFPLRRHFEQNIHVDHRLRRYGAGRRMEFDDAPPEAIATAIAEEIDRGVDYQPVTSGGAGRAAAIIAELL